MDGLRSLSEDLAAAVESAGRVMLAVHARPRLPSTGVHWRTGLVVTANHTVHADEGLTVTRPDGRSAPGTLVGRDPAHDLAVLRVDDPADLAVAELGDSSAIRVGHMVLALGAGPRASWGVVSAIGAARARQGEGELFSLDLTLYAGFSGGPLVDARGRVVGVNTSGMSRQMQLAVPAEVVSRSVDELVRHGRIAQGYLGVSTQPVRLPEAVREQQGVDQQAGLIVVEVQPGSPAAAGLLLGDLILALDGQAVDDPVDLRRILRADRIGQRITVRVLRAGQVRDVELTVGERPRRPH
jgi:S1-C subfamily serine protease